MKTLSRRRLLEMISAGGVTASAGCGRSDDDALPATTSASTESADDTPTSTESTEEARSSIALVASMQGVGYWDRLTFTCLQGLANRESKRLYLTFREDDDRWLRWYQNEYMVETKPVESPYSLLTGYDWPLDGFVVVDQLVPDTANLAATYAATENLLPVTDTLLDEQDLPDLDVEEDLRDRFIDRSKAEIYGWAIEELWPQANRGVVANVATPGVRSLDVATQTPDSDVLYVRFEDSTKEDGYGASLGGLSLIRDGETVVRVVPGTEAESKYLVEDDGSWLNDRNRRIADRDQHWVYRLEEARDADRLLLDIGNQHLVKVATSQDGPYNVLTESEDRAGTGGFHEIRDLIVAEQGFFFELDSRPMFPDERELKDELLRESDDLCRVHGWVSRFPRGSEPHHVGHVTDRGGLVLPSLHDAANYSFHEQIDVDPGEQPRSGSPSSIELANNVYLMFVLSDGDSLWMHSRFQHENWLSTDRGELPFGWEIQPLLLELAPGMLDHYFKTSTDNDYFVASSSGIGSQFANRYSPSRLQRYLQRSKPYISRLGLRSLWVRNDSPDGLDDEASRTYADVLGSNIAGVLERYDDRGGRARVIDGMAWLPTELPDASGDGRAQKSVSDMVTEIRSIANESRERPLFIPIHVPVTHPADRPPDMRWGYHTAVEITRELDSERFVVLPPEEFFEFYAQENS